MATTTMAGLPSDLLDMIVGLLDGVDLGSLMLCLRDVIPMCSRRWRGTIRNRIDAHVRDKMQWATRDEPHCCFPCFTRTMPCRDDTLLIVTIWASSSQTDSLCRTVTGNLERMQWSAWLYEDRSPVIQRYMWIDGHCE